VQPMLSGSVLVMVGMTRDPLFGPLIAFGLGAIHVEILGDVLFRVVPLTDRDATDLVRALGGTDYSPAIVVGRPLISRQLRRCCCACPNSSRRFQKSASSI